MVVIEGKITPTLLNASYKYLSHAKVRWEWYRSTKRLTQCRRCQRWGHAASSCLARNPSCLKCAQAHETRNCTKSPDVPAVCANCRQDHPANYNGCEAYIKYKDSRERASNQMRERRHPNPGPPQQPPRRYIPAPPPAINPWTRSRADQTPASPLQGPREEFPPLRESRSAGPNSQGPPLPPSRDSRQQSPPAQSQSAESQPPQTTQEDHRPPMPNGWARLSSVAERFNREVDLDWIATQLEIFLDRLKTGTTPEHHLEARSEYVRAIKNGRPTP